MGKIERSIKMCFAFDVVSPIKFLFTLCQSWIQIPLLHDHAEKDMIIVCIDSIHTGPLLRPHNIQTGPL